MGISGVRMSFSISVTDVVITSSPSNAITSMSSFSYCSIVSPSLALLCYYLAQKFYLKNSGLPIWKTLGPRTRENSKTVRHLYSRPTHRGNHTHSQHSPSPAFGGLVCANVHFRRPNVRLSTHCGRLCAKTYINAPETSVSTHDVAAGRPAVGCTRKNGRKGPSPNRPLCAKRDVWPKGA